MKTLTLLGFVSLGLCLHPCVGQVSDPDKALAAFDKIEADYTSAIGEYQAALAKVQVTAAYKDAAAARDNAKLNELRSAVPAVSADSYLARCKKLEASARGTAAGGKALAWIVAHDRSGAPARNAIDVLVAHYVESEHILPFAESMDRASRTIGRNEYRDLVSKLIGKNPDKMVRAYAHYHRSNLNRPRKGGGFGGSTGNKTQHEADLAKCVELAEGTSLADRANAPAFARDHLQIGMQVPDIEGKDLDGVGFKLSDYKGKVVMLDFWGDW